MNDIDKKDNVIWAPIAFVLMIVAFCIGLILGITFVQDNIVRNSGDNKHVHLIITTARIKECIILKKGTDVIISETKKDL